MIARYGDTDYGYSEAGYGYGVSAFTGFDGLSIIPDTLGWWSVSRRVLNRYNGPAIRLRRSSDSAERDFYGIGPQGEVSTSDVRAWNGWNLLLNSVFANSGGAAPTSWTATNTGGGASSSATLSTVFAGETAWSLSTTLSGESFISQVSPSFAANTVVAVSVYVEAVSGAITQAGRVIGFSGSPAGITDSFPVCEANPSGGASGALQSGRLVVIRTFGATPGSFSIKIGVGVENNRIGTARISRPQVERASSFSTYEPRTTTAAGDSFLVTLYEQAENGRNLLAWTEGFDDSAWTKAGTSVSANTTINPVTGLTTADTLTEDTSTGAHTINATVPLVSGVTYTSSVYVKSNGRTSVSYRNDNDNATFIVNLTDGSVSSPVNCTATAIDAGGGWWRLVMTFTAIATGSRPCSLIRLRNGAGSTSYTGDGASGVLVWGAQLELGTIATTYERRTTHGAGTRLDFTQSTTTLQPIVCEQGVVVTENSRLAAKFVAADGRRMSIASSTAMFNALHTTGGTVLCVSRANDTAAAKLILSSASSSTGAGFRMGTGSNEVIQYSTGRLDVAGVATAGNSIVLSGANSQASSLRINAAVLDPDNGTAASRVSYWENGTQGASTNAQTGTPFVENAADNMTLGATSAGGSPHDGPISELALFSAAISTADRTAWQSRSGIFYTVAIS